MRRVLKIVMWVCFGLAVVAAATVAVLVNNAVDLDDGGQTIVIALFASPFFLVLGFNALVWSRFDSWGGRATSRGARIGIIVAAVIVLAALSIVAVFLLILGFIVAYSAIGSVG